MRAFNVEFYKESQQRLVEEIEAAFGARFSYVLPANLSQLVCLNQHAELQQAYAKASHCVCESAALAPVFKLCKRELPEVIPMRDLAETFLEKAAQHDWPVTIIGCEPRIVRMLRRRYPTVTLNHHYPPIPHMHNRDVLEACLKFISEHPAPIALFSLPYPAQELLAMQTRDRGSIEGVGLCVGNALERLVEEEEPAPAWVQTLKLDRLHSSARSLDCSVTELLRFAPIAARQYWASRAEATASEPTTAPHD
ncbi:UDP-N-acetyl-D-mannosaminuronic acid transferase, WecB/TagA/CpsF family [Halopseudomonas xinjiangensis]|uniref:UDP-N-acetyl-D-mannosaminuronic acid transferase, WecB/TagA/CpsF family n=1 Tax=Halopseudomonas xinjiangensis TaxID=487184 RepID=A0A1H1SZL9_9GAMM|nr:WecB/TagA/CpsF family glycosyltransferase [Halopseudomonas xinjiangensis]SDS53371.1 UDP-N-acetyl-D-mannosaminuronic acid transferase, WecB/TagA/CpsF family [Halopseudomonas xinjiangensis]